MPIEQFIDKKFHKASQALIDTARDIIGEYSAQGFSLTVRQLYYQFVARGFIENSERSYKRLGTVINNARLAGLIDWMAIEDRTRYVRANPHWDTPADIIKDAMEQFTVDKWAMQPWQPEVWIEKDALLGVIAGVCGDLDIPYFACRGYTSQSEQWRAGKRFESAIAQGKRPIVFHLGDHDPSGVDMTRDNLDRLRLFARSSGVEVKRLALNWEQIERYRPPPNPTKQTDTRSTAYIQRFGYESWELDALEPRVIADLIRAEVEAIRDDDLWAEAVDLENRSRLKIGSFLDQLNDQGHDIRP